MAKHFLGLPNTYFFSNCVTWLVDLKLTAPLISVGIRIFSSGLIKSLSHCLSFRLAYQRSQLRYWYRVMVGWTGVPLDRDEARPRQSAADRGAEPAVDGKETPSGLRCDCWCRYLVWDLGHCRWLF